MKKNNLIENKGILLVRNIYVIYFILSILTSIIGKYFIRNYKIVNIIFLFVTILVFIFNCILLIIIDEKYKTIRFGIIFFLSGLFSSLSLFLLGYNINNINKDYIFSKNANEITAIIHDRPKSEIKEYTDRDNEGNTKKYYINEYSYELYYCVNGIDYYYTYIVKSKFYSEKEAREQDPIYKQNDVIKIYYDNSNPQNVKINIHSKFEKDDYIILIIVIAINTVNFILYTYYEKR